MPQEAPASGREDSFGPGGGISPAVTALDDREVNDAATAVPPRFVMRGGGVKDSSKDLPRPGVDADSRLAFRTGCASLLFAGLERGCSGVGSAAANVFPEPVVDRYRASTDGDGERVRELQSAGVDLRSALKRGSYLAGVKAALRVRNSDFDVDDLRAPLRVADRAKRTALETDLQEGGVL